MEMHGHECHVGMVGSVGVSRFVRLISKQRGMSLDVDAKGLHCEWPVRQSGCLKA